VGLRKHLASAAYDGLPGYKRRFVARQKQRGMSDIFDGAESSLGNRGRHARKVLRPERFHAFRANVSGSTAFTVTLCCASSMAAVRTKPSRPALLAA